MALYRRYIQRDPFLLEVARWFKDKGDETLRLKYPLTEESIVFDIGGYQGDFAAAINKKYGCKVYLFEPVQEFYQNCVARFSDNPYVICLNFGLSSKDDYLDIALAEDATSFSAQHIYGESQKVKVCSIANFIAELAVTQIDLIKINIEGGEYDVIPAIIDSEDIYKIRYLQIQFHNFIEGAVKQRADIRKQLKNTHNEMWNYEFVWESWEIKGRLL